MKIKQCIRCFSMGHDGLLLTPVESKIIRDIISSNLNKHFHVVVKNVVCSDCVYLLGENTAKEMLKHFNTPIKLF